MRHFIFLRFWPRFTHLLPYDEVNALPDDNCESELRRRLFREVNYYRNSYDCRTRAKRRRNEAHAIASVIRGVSAADPPPPYHPRLFARPFNLADAQRAQAMIDPVGSFPTHSPLIQQFRKLGLRPAAFAGGEGWLPAARDFRFLRIATAIGWMDRTGQAGGTETLYDPGRIIHQQFGGWWSTRIWLREAPTGDAAAWLVQKMNGSQAGAMNPHFGYVVAKAEDEPLASDFERRIALLNIGEPEQWTLTGLNDYLTRLEELALKWSRIAPGTSLAHTISVVATPAAFEEVGEDRIPPNFRSRLMTKKEAAEIHRKDKVANPTDYFKKLIAIGEVTPPLRIGGKWKFDVRNFPESVRDKLN